MIYAFTNFEAESQRNVRELCSGHIESFDKEDAYVCGLKRRFRFQNWKKYVPVLLLPVWVSLFNSKANALWNRANLVYQTFNIWPKFLPR